MKIEELIKINQYDFYDFMGQGKYHEGYRGNKYSYIKYKDDYKDFGFYPGVYTYKFKGLDKEDINDLIKSIKNRKVPSALWVEDLNENKGLINALSNNDFNLGFKSAGMYLNINEFMDSFDSLDNKNVEIKLVDSDELLYKWARVLIDGWWTWYKGKEEDLFNVYSEIYKKNDAIRLYIALYDNKPAGTALSFYSNDAVGLYLISTHSDYRNKGIGKLLTKAPIVDGHRMGYKHAVLYATDMGERVYKKLGFKKYFDTHSYWIDVRNKDE